MGLFFIRAQPRSEEAEVKGFKGKGQQPSERPVGGSVEVRSVLNTRGCDAIRDFRREGETWQKCSVKVDKSRRGE